MYVVNTSNHPTIQLYVPVNHTFLLFYDEKRSNQQKGFLKKRRIKRKIQIKKKNITNAEKSLTTVATYLNAFND